MARDNTGSVKDIRAGFIQRAASVLHDEAPVACYGLDRVAQLRVTRIILGLTPQIRQSVDNKSAGLWPGRCSF